MYSYIYSYNVRIYIQPLSIIIDLFPCFWQIAYVFSCLSIYTINYGGFLTMFCCKMTFFCACWPFRVIRCRYLRHFCMEMFWITPSSPPALPSQVAISVARQFVWIDCLRWLLQSPSLADEYYSCDSRAGRRLRPEVCWRGTPLVRGKTYVSCTIA